MNDNKLYQHCETASYLLAALALITALAAHLIPALLAGFLVYQLVHTLAPRIKLQRLHGTRARLAVVALLASAVTAGVAGIIAAIALFFTSGEETLTLLLSKMAEILENFRATLPPSLVHYLPENVNDMQSQLASWLREHAEELKGMGKEAGIITAHTLVGIVIGAMISLREADNAGSGKPLSSALGERISRFGDAFRNVVFAQLRIAIINSVITALYLAVILPLAGVELPLVKTMVLLTLVFGLLPVVGNLISNTVIVVVSLSYSPNIALASLVFLIVVHKAEYFLNARIIGTQIRAKPWELLLAMLVMEALFGLAGAIVAPVYYAYLKDELAARGLL